MKDFMKLDFNVIEELSTKKLLITEKLDMFYFKVIIRNDYIDVLNAKSKPITEIDMIVNSVYTDIVNFVMNKLSLKYDEIMNKIGECNIGFFYLPVNKSRVIDYTTIEYRSFILSDVYTIGKKIDYSLDVVQDILDGISMKAPVICECNGFNYDYIIECIKNGDAAGALSNLTDGKTYSGLSIDCIEGAVITCGKNKYQITINDTKDYSDGKFTVIGRDLVLSNFSRVMCGDEQNFIKTLNICRGKGTPIEKICRLFAEYISKTDISARTSISEDDMVPGFLGYSGTMNIDAIPSTAGVICKFNPIYRNILKILLVSLSNENYEKKFSRMDESTRFALCEICKELKS